MNVIFLINGLIMLFAGCVLLMRGGQSFNALWCIGIAILLFVFGRMEWKAKARSRSEKKAKKKSAPVRSNWEAHIVNHIRYKFPYLQVETNNRSIIRAKGSLLKKLEIDIWIPSLNLGIEANGEKYHDHAAYLKDVMYGTCSSKEMYKENYCRRKGITLLHVWSSEDFNSICHRIDQEIQCRLNPYSW